MQKIDFYQLPRSAQERLVGSINGRGLPEPILRTVSRPLGPLVWLGVSASSIVLLIVFFVLGYGSLASRLARQGPAWLVVDIGLAALIALGLLRALARQREHASSPFRRGIYVFPVGLIDARQPMLRLYPIEDMAGVVGPDARGLTLNFSGASFSFPVRDPALATAAKEQLAGARTAVSEAGLARESIRPKALAALDPLRGYANPLASSDSMKRRAPSWIALIWPLAGLTGVVLGGPLWMIRNARSDDAAYSRAVAANDSASYRAYLQSGSRHVPEVSSLLLPRALLHDAQQVGTVEAIEQFIKDNPQPSIQVEAQAALRAALLAQLDIAVKAGTLAALDDFSHNHPGAHLDAELASARHGVYQAAYAGYAATVTDKSSATLPFVKRLLDWSEKHGPKVELRFHWKSSKTMDKADGAAGKSRQFKGAAPSRRTTSTPPPRRPISTPSRPRPSSASRGPSSRRPHADRRRPARGRRRAARRANHRADALHRARREVDGFGPGEPEAARSVRGARAGLRGFLPDPPGHETGEGGRGRMARTGSLGGPGRGQPGSDGLRRHEGVAFQQFQDKLLRTLFPGAK